MIEVKTRVGAKNSRSYPVGQLMNYIRLAVECRKLKNTDLPSAFSHLILVPNAEPKWLMDNERWVETVRDPSDGRMIVDPDACMDLGFKGPEVNRNATRALLSCVPIYYRSWTELSDSFRKGLSLFGDERNAEHWRRVGSEIQELSERAVLHAEK